MVIAIAIPLTLAIGALIAFIVFWTPGLGVRKRPHLSLLLAGFGLVVAAVTLVVMVGAPFINGMAGSDWWSTMSVTYFLASANRLIGGPYAFFWTPTWMYPVGSLTPFAVLGAMVALAGGYFAMPVARRAGIICVIVAASLLVAYVVAGVYAAWIVRDGIPV